MPQYGSYLDLRLNYLCCCGSGFQHSDQYSYVAYAVSVRRRQLTEGGIGLGMKDEVVAFHYLLHSFLLNAIFLLELPTYTGDTHLQSYNYSAPRLPKGLELSTKYKRPVIYPANYADAVWAFNLGNSSEYWAATVTNCFSLSPLHLPAILWAKQMGITGYPGLSCPYLKRVDDPDQQYYLLNWFIDPGKCHRYNYRA